MSAHVARNGPGIGVEPAAGGKSNDNADRLAFKGRFCGVKSAGKPHRHDPCNQPAGASIHINSPLDNSTDLIKNFFLVDCLVVGASRFAPLSAVAGILQRSAYPSPRIFSPSRFGSSWSPLSLNELRNTFLAVYSSILDPSAGCQRFQVANGGRSRFCKCLCRCIVAAEQHSPAWHRIFDLQGMIRQPHFGGQCPHDFNL